jgi:hypothetical protein
MQFDFTFTVYLQILKALQKQGFSFQSFGGFLEDPKEKVIILRHDVDLSPKNSLLFSQLEYELDIKGSYYFRIVSESFNEAIINEIAQKGHEIGYHYEDVSLAVERQKTKVKGQKCDSDEDYERYLTGIAIKGFSQNLERLRKIVPIKTICMHGSPMSRWDSRILWKYFNYKDFGIAGEPYFGVNFEEVLYLTDTGRCWDGGTVSIRDKGLGIWNEVSGEERYKGWKVKPVSGSLMNMTHASIDFQNKYKFGSTSEIISEAEKKMLPDKMMITFHPQRWTGKLVPWVKELVWQNMKNVAKYILVKTRD